MEHYTLGTSTCEMRYQSYKSPPAKVREGMNIAYYIAIVTFHLETKPPPPQKKSAHPKRKTKTPILNYRELTHEHSRHLIAITSSIV